MRHRPAPPTRFLRVRQDRGYTVLDFRGEIDIVAEVEVVPHLDAATSAPKCRVVIDLTRVEFLDASGLRLLYRARQRVLEQHGRLYLVCTDALTLRVLRITGLARLLPPRPTLEAALDQSEATPGPV
ncbi:anti-sigma factor antagonist [Streptomyces sp. QTS137]